jgi:dTDP-4-dehydrorhamnose reductase
MNASPTILLTGKNGQVGWELQRTIAPLGNVIAVGREEMDLADPDSIRRVIREIKPSLIINAAAYTAVDKAEEEPELAMAVNGTAVGVLAEEAKKRNALFIHYSTDYIFDGTKPTPYTEEDAPNPINAYGRSKLAGEEAIKQTDCEHIIFRTSWVYAARGNNFLKTMLRLAREQDELKAVADQFGAPTSAELIADVTALTLYRINANPMQESPLPLKEGWGEGFNQIVANKLSDTYHLVASGETSWHGYSQLVLETAIKNGHNLRISPDQVIPIKTADYPLPAKRPANSTLDTIKLCQTFGVTLPPWEFHIKRAVAEIVGWER